MSRSEPERNPLASGAVPDAGPPADQLAAAQAEIARLSAEVDNLSREIRAHGMVTVAITASLSIAEIFEAIVSAIEECISFDRFAIALPRDGGVPETLVVHSLSIQAGVEDAKVVVVPKKGSVYDWAVRQRRTLCRRDLTTEPMFLGDSTLIEEGIRSHLVLALLCMERPVGVLELGSCQVGRYTQKDAEILERLTGQIAVAIENSHLYDRIQESNTKLQNANRLKTEFLANASHELRTPMNSILGFTDLLLDGVYGEITPQQREIVGEVDKSGKHLLALISDLLDLSKIEAEQMKLDLSVLDIGQCVRSVVTSMKPLADERGVDLLLDLEPDLPLCAVDNQKISRVFWNLLSNAVKFTREGRVEVGVKVCGDDLLCWVADTGIGIAEHHLASIFDPFRRISQEYEGTGLGLSITKRLIELHGGSIRVESVPGCGSKFVFSIPMEPSLSAG